jgi:hypothetical protein
MPVLTAQNTQHLQEYRKTVLSRPLFDRQMARLEAGKGEDFDPRTLAVWYDEMTRLGWSDDFFVERCKAVMGAKVYGKISFDMSSTVMTLFQDIQMVRLQEVCVVNFASTWAGFNHDTLDSILMNSMNIQKLTLTGCGTGSYLDRDSFNYKLASFQSTVLTYHWYVGIRNARKTFLESQAASLKTLEIEELPYDFDGGKVLKYVFESLQLDTFIINKSHFIKSGTRQFPRELTFNEIQLTAAIYLLTEFPSITKLTLILNNTDIDSDTVENTLRNCSCFRNITHLIVREPGTRDILGVYLDLFKSCINLQTLELETSSRNLWVLYGEFRILMPHLTKYTVNGVITNCALDYRL